jgi:hypothetical protein
MGKVMELQPSLAYIDAATQILSNVGIRNNSRSIAFARDFEFHLPQIQEQQYAPLLSEELIPYTAEGPAIADSIHYKMIEAFGKPEWASLNDDEVPDVGASIREFSQQVRHMHIGYSYTVADLERSALTGVKLDATTKNTALQALRFKHQDVAFLGNTAFGWEGFLNSSVITAANASALDWSNRTAVEIADSILKMEIDITNRNEQLFLPTTLILPTSVKGDMKKIFGSGSDTTVQKHVLENLDYVKEIKYLKQLNTAGAGATGRAIIYQKSPDVLRYRQQKLWKAMAPQLRGMKWHVAVASTSGGLALPAPAGIGYFDGL